jgi:hypothetical protein
VENIKEEFGTIMRFLEPQSFRSEVAMSFARIRELLEASHLKEGNVNAEARGGGTSEPELTASHPPVIPAGEQVATGTMGGQATAQAPEPVPDEGMQNGSNQPAPECCDMPREQEVGDVSGTPGEEETLEWRLSESSEEVDDDVPIRELFKASHLKKGNVAVDAQGGGTSRPDEATPGSCDTPMEEEEVDISTPGEEEALEGIESSEEDEDEGGHEGRKRRRQYEEGRGGGLRRSNRSCVQAKRFRHLGGKGSLASDPIVL